MKRKNLTTAVVAGLAGIAGLSSISNAAVNMNNDGVGQVLIYPYYTVNEDADGNALNTLISVVNTTEYVKGVKVRFLEGKNSREVLDFNVYLSPYDVWTAALVPVDSTVAGHVDEPSAKILVSDSTCTSPNDLNGQEFLPYFYTSDPVSSNMQRVKEGHIEVIEMGNFPAGSNSAAWATHAGGTPPACGNFDTEWSDKVWGNTLGAAEMDSVSGGIFGSASIIDVAGGTDVAYNARALNGWTRDINHSYPGNVLPDLNSASADPVNPLVVGSLVFDGGNVVASWWPRGVEAVSAPFMRDNLYAEYELTASINAQTSYVITFPTKAYYVDNFRAGGAAPIAPFETTIGVNGACEIFTPQVWDQEEGTAGPGGVIVSPPPPEGNDPVLCWESNILNFEFDTTVSDVFHSQNAYNIDTGFAHGWVDLMFSQSTNRAYGDVNLAPASVQTYYGLPMTGFAVQRYANGTLGRAEGSVLANYAGLFNHRYHKTITSN